MVLFSAFIAEALPAVLLYYGLSWRLTRTTPASWGAHLLIIGALCVAVAGVRYASAFVVGGTFALESTTAWSLVVPLTLSFAAAMWLRGRVGDGDRADPGMPPAAAAVPAHQAADTLPPQAPRAAPPPAPTTPMPTGHALLWAGGALLVMVLVLGGFALLTVVASGSQAPPSAASQESTRAIVDPFQPSSTIVDPFKVPLGDRARVRNADPAWTAALAEWEGRYREWLLIPGAREVFTESLLIEDSEGTAQTYAQLLDLAGRRAARALQERQRQQRAAPCPPGLIPDPSFNNQCNLPEAVEANKQAAQR